MNQEQLSKILRELPLSPGIYRFYDKDRQLLYVGKAKELRKRVSSYFNQSRDQNRKTRILVQAIETIEYTLTPTEFDALLLENNFIKEHQPRFNFLLKDDKTFPYICILNEPFPRIISTRKFQENHGEYFGPFASASAMKAVLDLVRKLHHVRTCNLLLSPANIAGQKFKVCLEYHIGNCKGPCENLVGETEYLQEIQQARKILQGRLTDVSKYYEAQMQNCAERLEFEKAENYRLKIEQLEKYHAKNAVVNKSLQDLDVITILSNETHAWVNFLQVREGAVLTSINREITKKLEETDNDILGSIYEDLQHHSPYNHELILSNVDFPHNPNKNLLIPQIGDKRKLVELSLENGHTLRQKRENTSHINRTVHDLMLKAQQDLRLTELPLAIECFDNSNLQGTDPVSAMVRFESGKPAKKGYRMYHVKSVVGPDDFATMKEIIRRRYSRLLNENQPLPQLVIVDGGKGQLSSACEALKELNIYGRLPIIGIAKNLEEIFFPEDGLPLMLSKRSTTLRLIQHMRDEAHRFGLRFHRKTRSKRQLHSAADTITGIGPSTKEELLRHFRSWKKVLDAPLEELAQLIGKKKAEIIKGSQHKEQ